MFAMISQFMERSTQPPQPPFYQAPIQLYNPIHPTHHSSQFPVASSPSPTQPLPFFQDLNQALPFNNTPRLTQSFFQAPANTQGQQAFNNKDHHPSFQSEEDETHLTML